MSSAMSLIGGLFGLNVGSPARGRTRSRRCRDDQRLQVPAEISPLEQRCLLSGGAHGGGHHEQAGAAVQSGNPVLLNWDGYQWDANYSWSQDSGNYVNGQVWSPSNSVVEPDGLHLNLTNTNGTMVSAEVDLVGTTNGAPMPGYGTYLVNVQTGNGQNWNQWTENRSAIFGAFTYENLHGVGTVNLGADGKSSISGLPQSVINTLKRGMEVSGNNYTGARLFRQGTTIQSISGGTVHLSEQAHKIVGSAAHTIYFVQPKTKPFPNVHRELDTAEISRFGTQYTNTDAQFTIQPATHHNGVLIKKNVHRMTLNSDQITLVMKWTGQGQPATFSEYDGTYNLSNLPAIPTNTWTTTADQDPNIPNSNYQTFHLNVWQAYWTNQAPQPTSVVVTNFQYQPGT